MIEEIIVADRINTKENMADARFDGIIDLTVCFFKAGNK